MRPSDLEQRESFEAEMLPHLDAAYRVAWGLTGHQQDAEDLVQETFLRAYRGYRRYQRGSNARAWLLTIMRNAFLNARRAARARPTAVSLDAVEGAIDAPDTKSPGPEEQVLSDIDRQAVLRALAELPEFLRSVLALVDLAGMRYAEAAQVLRCPIGTVMSRLYRGRRELAKRLQTSELWSGNR
jgi:RNA polymerase sigma-70 factor (ECF subfamily)